MKSADRLDIISKGAIVVAKGLATRVTVAAAAPSSSAQLPKNRIPGLSVFGLAGPSSDGRVYCHVANPASPLFCALASAEKSNKKSSTVGGGCRENHRERAPENPASVQHFPEIELDRLAAACYLECQELENSFCSGRRFRQGGDFRKQSQDRIVFGLGEGRPREDRRTTTDVFSTSSSPFLCPRENGSKKQTITFSVGGCHEKYTERAPENPASVHSIFFDRISQETGRSGHPHRPHHAGFNRFRVVADQVKEAANDRTGQSGLLRFADRQRSNCRLRNPDRRGGFLPVSSRSIQPSNDPTGQDSEKKMRKYTFADVFEMERNDAGGIDFPAGDYSAVEEFPADSRFESGCVFSGLSSFGSGCRFGFGCVFGPGCEFGENCEFDSGCRFSAGFTLDFAACRFENVNGCRFVSAAE